MIETVNNLINDGKIREALRMIIDAAQKAPDEDPAWEKIDLIARQYASRSAIIEREKSLGILGEDSYREESNKILYSTIQLAKLIEDGDFQELADLETEDDDQTHRKKRIREADFIDKAFKLLLLVLFLISIVALFRSTIMTQGDDWKETILGASISLIGGSGSFLAYFRWRLAGLQ